MISVLRKYPSNIIEEDKIYFKNILSINLPEPNYIVLQNTLLLKKGILINAKGVEINSLLYDSRINDLGGNKTLVKLVIKSIIKLNFKVFNDANSIFVASTNEWSNNYFHWFTEVLPRLFYIKSLYPTLTILLPNTYNRDYQIETLNLLGYRFEYFKTLAFVSKVICPTRQAPSSGNYNPVIIRSMANFIKRAAILSHNLGKYIYISRKNALHRKVLNENKVIEVLLQYKFSIVDLEQYSLKQQISIAHNAKFIVGIHGAGLTNIIFAKEGVSILEFAFKNEFDDKCYFTLANACGLNYYYQLCSKKDESISYHTADIIVDIEELKNNLNVIINTL